MNLRLYNHRHQGCVGGDPKVSQPGTFNSGTAMQGQYREPLIESITISDFAGRTFEYFSEDGYLFGVMASQQVAGAPVKA